MSLGVPENPIDLSSQALQNKSMEDLSLLPLSSQSLPSNHIQEGTLPKTNITSSRRPGPKRKGSSSNPSVSDAILASYFSFR